MSLADWYQHKAVQCAQMAKADSDPHKCVEPRQEQKLWLQIAADISGCRDQGGSKPFAFIIANEVGDEINEDKAFAACIFLLLARIPAAYELNFPA